VAEKNIFSHDGLYNKVRPFSASVADPDPGSDAFLTQNQDPDPDLDPG
jgi:hypothetical protein